MQNSLDPLPAHFLGQFRAVDSGAYADDYAYQTEGQAPIKVNEDYRAWFRFTIVPSDLETSYPKQHLMCPVVVRAAASGVMQLTVEADSGGTPHIEGHEEGGDFHLHGSSRDIFGFDGYFVSHAYLMF